MNRIVSDKKNSSRRAAYAAILLFVLAISAVFVWGLFTAPSVNYTETKFGYTEEDNLELSDGHSVDLVFRAAKDQLAGLVVDGYNNNGVRLSGETLKMSVFREPAGILLQETKVLLKDQIPEKSILMLIDQEIAAGTELRLHVETEGLTNQAILLKLSSGSGVESQTLLDGNAVNDRFLCAKAYYRTKPSRLNLAAVIKLASGLLIALLLLFAVRSLSLPLYVRSSLSHTVATGKRERITKRLLGAAAAVLVLAVFLAVFWDYVYTFSVEKESLSYVPEVPRSSGIQTRTLALEEEELTQEITVSGRDFAGIVLPPFPADVKSGVLECSVSESKGGLVLASGVLDLAHAQKLSKNLSSEVDEQTRKAIRGNVCLLFDRVLHDSEGRTYLLTFRIREAEDGIPLQTITGRESRLFADGKELPYSIDFIVLEQSNTFLRGMFAKVALFLTLMLCAVLVLCILFRPAVHWVFLICFLSLGVCFNTVIPSYCVPDERSHIDSAYVLSNRLLGIEDSLPGRFDWKRSGDIDGTRETSTSYVTAERYREVHEAFLQKAPQEQRELVPAFAGDVSFNATKLHYLAPAIGFSVARLLYLNYESMLLFGRFASLLALAFILFLAIRKVPAGKGIFAAAALFPMVLQEGASCSYDALMIGSGFLFIAYYRHILDSEQISLCDLMVLLGSGALLALSKGGVYIPVLGVLVLLPVWKRENRRAWTAMFFLTLAGLGMLYISNFAGRLSGVFGTASAARFRDAAESGLFSPGYLLDHPKQYLRILQNTLFVKGDEYLQGILGGNLGKLNIMIPWFILTGFIVVIAVTAAAAEHQHRTAQSTAVGSWYLLLAAVSSILICTALLFDLTPADEAYIMGVQGRYFLPVLPLVLLAIAQRDRGEEPSADRWAVFLCAVLSAVTVGLVLRLVL